MGSAGSIKATHESTLLNPSSLNNHPHSGYATFANSKQVDLEAMTKNSTERQSRPLVLLGSAGLALLLICLCAFSSNAEAASVARSLIGLESQTSRLMPRAVTSSYAYQRMLANVGGAPSTAGGNQVPNVQTGAVIASPSTAGPNYFYSWVRDAALTMKVAVSQPTLDRQLLVNYANAEKVHQQNAASSSSGQGEPKFNVDGSLFTGPWGRPQSDGAAIRASTLIAFAKRIGLTDPFVTGTLYKSDLNGGSVIKTDLEYVSKSWGSSSSFDLWEEVQGQHFFTLMVQYRALIDGAKFATSMNDPGAATYYNQQAAAIKSKLQTFWDSNAGYIQAYQGVSGRSGLDCSVMLGALKGWDTSDTSAAVDATVFGPASDKVLATHRKYVDSFRSLYAINGNTAAPAAVGTGRYPEDVYDGNGSSQGNPWYICTLAAAELLNTVVSVANTRGNVSVTSTSLPFYTQFSSSAATGTFSSGSSQYTALTSGMKAMADGFVNIVNSHSWPNGSLNEEFNRNTGYNQGARDLTWSYAAFVSNDLASQGKFLIV
ncbi:related to Glucoamylase precursor [Melanopsichium pennsylvanicum]|uniref:glucan 1,4-alpha-glucosidase n=2 Tax=Melanopsichium pennsylvanicum TaxID=63383 RepID=A0AAJ5C6L5_9BASI|nr:related to Glucoamylase precursor [Melanopsichium pennsylvanicum 4]SNX85663.1 related to Glucoamylase precursor [Melanopsichium pennsylvanicum]